MLTQLRKHSRNAPPTIHPHHPTPMYIPHTSDKLLMVTTSRTMYQWYSNTTHSFLFIFFYVPAVHPLIQVPNQLVGAPVGTDVTLVCNAEASPKAINYWQRENGEYRQTTQRTNNNWSELHFSIYQTYIYKMCALSFCESEVRRRPAFGFGLIGFDFRVHLIIIFGISYSLPSPYSLLKFIFFMIPFYCIVSRKGRFFAGVCGLVPNRPFIVWYSLILAHRIDFIEAFAVRAHPLFNIISI